MDCSLPTVSGPADSGCGEFVFFEAILTGDKQDFSSTYLAVKHLLALIKAAPDRITGSTLTALATQFDSRRHTSQKMALLLFREVADAIRTVAELGTPTLREEALGILYTWLQQATGIKHRAVAESMAGFPTSITPPEIPGADNPSPTPVHWEALTHEAGIPEVHEGVWAGRSYLATTSAGLIAVVKCMPRNASSGALYREAKWLDLLRTETIQFKKPFHIPEPVTINGSFLFTIEGLPVKDAPAELGSPVTAICFITTPDYYAYPNDRRSYGHSLDESMEIITRNAFHFGEMTSKGIIHTAPIPLFHNRTQHNRREDGGIYLWRKGGRLDRWLESSDFPNFSQSGLRDFEHLEPLPSGQWPLYEAIGNQLLSLILVSGSCFRRVVTPTDTASFPKAPEDFRHLFDPDVFSDILKGVITEYYHGFTGLRHQGNLPVDTASLALCLTDAMGVDSDMEEILRVADQNAMTDDEFVSFLQSRNLPEETISGCTKGEADISILSGPHLGGFNRKISVPELIVFLESVSAFLITEKFRASQKRNAGRCPC